MSVNQKTIATCDLCGLEQETGTGDISELPPGWAMVTIVVVGVTPENQDWGLDLCDRCIAGNLITGDPTITEMIGKCKEIIANAG